jgi:predicted phage tail protein
MDEWRGERVSVRIHTYLDALTRTGHRVRSVEPGLRLKSLVELAWDGLAERAPSLRGVDHRVVILNGAIVRDGSELDRESVDGDELHVAPGMPGWQTVILIAIAITSAILSFALTPRIGLAEQPSDNAESRFGFGRYSRAAARGEPIPVVFGRKRRYGGVRVLELPGEGENGDQMARLLIVLGEGPFNRIGSLTGDTDRSATATGIYLNDQPLENFGPDVRVSVRMGTASQTMIPGFVDSESLREVGAGTNGALLANTSGSERTGGSASGEAVLYTTVDSVDAVTLRVSFLTGLFQLSSNGQIQERTASWRYRTRLTAGPGAWSAWTVQTLRKAERSSFTQAVRVDNLSGGGAPAQFDVQLERVSVEAAGAGVSYADEMHFDSVVETRYEQNVYPDVALLAIEINASERISSIPRVSAEVEGHADVRVWDGVSSPSSPAFTRGYSNNPAWVALEILTNTRWGMGESDDRIDLAGLIECAQNVPTWKDAAGEEHPFECNIALDDAKEPIDWLRAVCALMRVTPVPAGKWYFVQSRRRDAAVETFGDGSIARDDSGKLLMSIGYPAATGGRAGAPNQIRMQFENADNDGESDLVVFPEAGDLWLGEDWDGGAEPPVPKTGKFVGEMPEGQAMSEAIYEAKRIRARTTTVEFTSTRQAVVCQPEDRIDVACSVAGWGVSGRLLTGWQSPGEDPKGAIRLDRELEIEDGVGYSVVVTHRDTSVEVVQLDVGVGIYPANTTLVLYGEGLATAPADGAEYAIGKTGVQMRPMIVESVRAEQAGESGADFRWVIAASAYSADVFDPAQLDVSTVNYSNLGGPRTAPGPVLSLTAVQRIVNGEMIVELGWTQSPADAAHTREFVVFRRDNGTVTWIAQPGVTAGRTHVDVTIVERDVAYDFIVVARSALGAQLSPYDTRHPIVSVAFGLGVPPPPAPSGLAITQIDGNVYELSWDAVENAASYQVLAGGDTGTGRPNDGAEDCLVLARTAATSLQLELPAGRSCTFYVRSCTQAGRLSFTASSVTEASPDAPTGESIEDTHVADFAGGEGTFTNCAWNGSASRVEITDPTDAGGGVWESGAIDTGAATAKEICLRPTTANAAEDPDIFGDGLPFGVPSMEADQWGIVSGAGDTAAVGMLMPPWPDDQQSWLFEVATSTDGTSYTDYTPLAFGASLAATLRYYKVRATMKRKVAAKPYTPALAALAIVCTS